MPFKALILHWIALPLLLAFSIAGQAAINWEYLVKTYPLMGNDQQLTKAMNKLGKQQWELVNCTEGSAKLTCIFKRSIKQG